MSFQSLNTSCITLDTLPICFYIWVLGSCKLGYWRQHCMGEKRNYKKIWQKYTIDTHPNSFIKLVYHTIIHFHKNNGPCFFHPHLIITCISRKLLARGQKDAIRAKSLIFHSHTPWYSLCAQKSNFRAKNTEKRRVSGKNPETPKPRNPIFTEKMENTL